MAEALPIPAKPDASSKRLAQSTDEEFDAAGLSFASRLNESQTNANSQKKSSTAVQRGREVNQQQVTRNRAEEIETPGYTAVEVISNSSILKNVYDEPSARKISSQAKGVAPVSELIDISATKIQSDMRADAQIAELLIDTEYVETKGPSSGEIAKAPLSSVSGDSTPDNAHTGSRNSAKAAPIPAMLSAGIFASAKQSQLTELFRRFDIESAELSKSASASEHGAKLAVEEFASKNTFTDLRPLALAPNIRRILISTTQTKQSHITDKAGPQIETEAFVPGGHKATSATSATSGDMYKALQNMGAQNNFASMMLNGPPDPSAALFEEFGALNTEGAKNNLELASEVIQRGTGPSHLRASFTLPERFAQRLRSGVKSITLQITPKHLGSAQLSVNVVNDRVSGTLYVESSAAKAAVEASIEQLANRLAAEGLSLDKLDVEVSERQRGREEFGAEKRSASENDASGKRHSAKDMTGRVVVDNHAPERRSIVTATRIDAVA